MHYLDLGSASDWLKENSLAAQQYHQKANVHVNKVFIPFPVNKMSIYNYLKCVPYSELTIKGKLSTSEVKIVYIDLLICLFPVPMLTKKAYPALYSKEKISINNLKNYVPCHLNVSTVIETCFSFISFL